MPRYLVLIPVDGEFHVATSAGRLITTTDRTRVAISSIEGRRPPLIGADNLGTGRQPVPSIDLVQLFTEQVVPGAAEVADPPAGTGG